MTVAQYDDGDVQMGDRVSIVYDRNGVAKVVRDTGFGLVGDLLIGVAGALFAGLLFPRLGLNLGGGLLSQILFAALGAIVLLLIVGLVRGRRA